MPRGRRKRLFAAAVLLGVIAVMPGLAACAQDRPAAVIGLADSAPPQDDAAPAELASEIDVAADQSVEEPGTSESVVDEPVEEPLTSESVVDEPVEEPLTSQPGTDAPIQARPGTDEPVESQSEAGELVAGDREELLTLLDEGDLDAEQQDEFMHALEELEPDEDAIAAIDEPVAEDEPVAGSALPDVASAPIGPMAAVDVFDTQPVGPRLSVSIGVRAGWPATGVPIIVVGQGLAPGSEATVNVYSTPQRIAAGLVDERGSVSLAGVLPGALDPGVHVIDGRATGADGSAVQSIGAFTIDADGLVEDVAPMGELLDPIQPDDPTLERALSAGVPIYDPARHPTVTVAAAIMAVAVVGLAGISRLASMPMPMPMPGAPMEGVLDPAPSDAGSRRPARLPGMKVRKMTPAGEGRQGWGDRGRSWRWPGTALVDRMVQRVALRLGSYTQLGSRIVDDGAWARAMLGSAGLTTWIVGAVLGLVAASSVGFGAFPPAAPMILPLVVIGILDATAGALAWVVLAAGVLVTGQLGGLDGVRTMLGMFALFVAIPLAANDLRPLRRAPATTMKEGFDRLADYVVMPVLIAWAGTSMLLALNGLSGLQLVDHDIIGPMRWAIAVALVARLAVEDLAAHGFPARLEAVRPREWPLRSLPVQLGSVALRVGVFVLVTAPFTGVGAITLVAAAMIAVPMLLRTAQDRLANVPWLFRYFPRGMASRLLTMVVAIYLAAWLLGPGGTSDHTPAMYNWLLLPGIIVGVVSAFGRDGRHWPDTWSKRSAGLLVWIALTGLTIGAITVPFL